MTDEANRAPRVPLWLLALAILLVTIGSLFPQRPAATAVSKFDRLMFFGSVPRPKISTRAPAAVTAPSTKIAMKLLSGA